MKVAIVAVVPDDWGDVNALAGLHEDAYNALCGALEDIGDGVTVDSIEAPAPAVEVLEDGSELLPAVGTFEPSEYDVRRDALNAAVALYAPMIQHPISVQEADNMRRHTRVAAVEFEQHLTRPRTDETTEDPK